MDWFDDGLLAHDGRGCAAKQRGNGDAWALGNMLHMPANELDFLGPESLGFVEGLDSLLDGETELMLDSLIGPDPLIGTADEMKHGGEGLSGDCNMHTQYGLAPEQRAQCRLSLDAEVASLEATATALRDEAAALTAQRNELHMSANGARQQLASLHKQLQFQLLTQQVLQQELDRLQAVRQQQQHPQQTAAGVWGATAMRLSAEGHGGMPRVSPGFGTPSLGTELQPHVSDFLCGSDDVLGATDNVRAPNLNPFLAPGGLSINLQDNLPSQQFLNFMQH